MKTENIILSEEFDKIWNKVEKGENFVLLRYGDGERSIMIGKKVTAQEGWVSPDYVSTLGKALLKTLNFNDDNNIYYGISCPCCDPPAYYWYNTRIKNKNITFANLFVNYNYKKFIPKFEKLKRDAIFIGNYRAENQAIGNLNILKYYTVSDDCFKFWENEAPMLLETIKNDFGNRDDLLYVVSAGPMSEPIIMNLYENNPNNCYIDFGSSIDKYIHENQTRPYMDENTPYAKLNCYMANPKIVDFDVSVVMTLYKRVESLEKQLIAIQNQTLKPKEILLFQDGIEGNYKIQLSEEFKKKFDIVEVSEKNCGVWERFKFAQKASSKYVCVFDDDTIPGERWLENCHTQMLKEEALYGTIGIMMKEPEKYANEGFFRVGWAEPLDITTQVDLVGHSWFFKKDWIEYLFEGTEDLQKFKTAGEDMSFSAQLQKHEIKTFVPPHPPKDKSLWGSLPDTANVLGNSADALWLTSFNKQRINDATNVLLKKGWSPLIKTNPEYVYKIKNLIKEKHEKAKQEQNICTEKTKFKLFGKTKSGNKRTIHIFGVKISWRKKDKSNNT